MKLWHVNILGISLSLLSLLVSLFCFDKLLYTDLVIIIVLTSPFWIENELTLTSKVTTKNITCNSCKASLALYYIFLISLIWFFSFYDIEEYKMVVLLGLINGIFSITFRNKLRILT